MNEIKVVVTSRESTVGHIMFYGLPYNLEYWSKIISEGELELAGEFRRYDAECNEIVYEGVAGPGLETDGCYQCKCEEQDCQFCISRTMGADNFLRLPANAEFYEIDSNKVVEDPVQVRLTLSEIAELTTAMIYRAQKMVEFKAPKIISDITIKRAERLNELLKFNGHDYWSKEKFVELKKQAEYK